MSTQSTYHMAPTEAAKELNILRLPVGTYIRFRTEQGYVGNNMNDGIIEKITKIGYIITKLPLGDGARIPFTSVANRRLTAVMTAQEYEAMREEARKEQDAKQVAQLTHDRQVAAEKEAARQESKAVAAATAELIKRHPKRYQKMLDDARLQKW